LFQTKYTRFCLIIPSAILLCFVLTIGGLYLWYYLDQFKIPLQPAAEGGFPTKPVWVFEAEDRIVSTPVIEDSSIFLRSTNHLISIDPLSGKLLWSTGSDVPYNIHTGDLTIAPLVNGDLIVVPEKGSSLKAYSITTGKERWKTPEIGANLKNPGTASIESYAIGGERLFVARFSWTLSAYDLVNGDLLWEKSLPDKALLNVAADSKGVYVGEDNILRIYDPVSGEVLWEKDFGSSIGKLLLDDKTLYVVLPDGPNSLIALDLDNLQVKWSDERDKFRGDELRTLALAGDNLYVGGNRLFNISKVNGAVLWESEKTGLLERPVTIKDKVIVRNTNKDLFLFDTITGQRLGQLKIRANTPMQHDPDRSPAVVNDLLIVPFGDNRIYAYRP